ncbi:hypothetical protein BDR22DRAFT_895220 [Usnea florida]
MGNSREDKVYRVRQLPLHLKDCGATASFLAWIAPTLGAADNIRVFSLAQEKPKSKTATVAFQTIPSIFDNDREEWTLQAEISCGQNIIVDTHFRGFTVLNEPQSSLPTVDCVAISGLASHPFGSWKHRETGSHFMWLRDRLPQDVPKLRSLIYGYDTRLFKSHSFQDLDDIARSFIGSLKVICRSPSPAKPLVLLAHSLGGIMVKRALALLEQEGRDEEKDILNSVKGLVFFGVPHKGMEISHLLAMVAKQPNEDLISRTLSADSELLSELDEQFTKIALRLNNNIKVVYETAESQLTERNAAGTWIRSETSYAVLVNKDSAIPPGTPLLNAIPVNKDHSNMVKFGEDDPVYQMVMSFIFDLTYDIIIQRDSYGDRTMSMPVQKNATKFSNVPFPRDSNFVGREKILIQIESEIGNPTSQRWASLYGLGGIGKSQIAIEYLYRQKKQSPQISTFWVHASSKARFEHSFNEIATKVEISETEKEKTEILQLVSRWLSNPANGPWLLILDNADDAKVLLDVPKVENRTNGSFVQRCLYDSIPQVPHGTVLITTRDQTCALDLAGDFSTPIKVEEMSTNEGILLLRKRLPDATEEEASELVEELENVPLAISQASAYIREVSITSISMYLTKIRRSSKDQAALLNKGKVDMRRDREVPNAVITSWELSFSQIREKSPGSADLLSLMSYLNRQAIPRRLLEAEIDDFDFPEVINPLLSFSLIRAEIGDESFEMHRLVQTAMQHWLQSEGCDQLWKTRAIERVADHFPPSVGQEEHWSLCEVLMSHADEVLLHVKSPEDMSIKHAILLDFTAWYLNTRSGNYGLAEERSMLALEILKHHFDDDADQVLTVSGTLASAKTGLGQLDKARDLQESIVKHRREKWGPEHPTTLSAMHNLAVSYAELGLYEKAEKGLKHVVEVREKVSGTEHPTSSSTANLLAHTQSSMGKYEEAERRSARTLEICKRRFGTEHLHTLNALNNLFKALLGQSNFKEAESEIVPAIPVFEKVYGPSHPKTLGCRLLLAQSYWRQARVDEAEEICTPCHAIAKEAYGPKNGITLDSKNLLGLIYRAQGKFDDALRLFENVLESDKIVSGPDHPNTLTAMFNLALCFYDKGDKGRAVQLMSEVLEKQREVLPEKHPNTIDSARQLARWKVEEGKIEEWETEEEWIEDSCGEGDRSEEDESEEDGGEEGVSLEEESDKNESEGEESHDNVGDNGGTVGQQQPRTPSLALRNRSREDHRGSDAA